MERRWLVFGDDVGDPGATGSPHFGYAVLAVPENRLAELVRVRAQFRVQHSVFAESKPRRPRPEHLTSALSDLHSLCEACDVRIAAALIWKQAYAGHWLRPKDGIPANSNFLRTYLVRKAIELAFDGLDCTDDSMELVLDRNGNGERQTRNVHRYLSGDFAEHGPFAMPKVTQVLYANSLYVEALQVADLIGRAVRWQFEGKLPGDLESCLACFVRTQFIVSGRAFTLHEEARPEMERRFGGQ